MLTSFQEKRLGTWQGIGIALVSASGFYLATSVPYGLGFLILTVLGLNRLTWTQGGRSSFWLGALLGMGMFVPPLGFFWTVFGPFALVLWGILASWVGAFVFLAARCRRRFRPFVNAMLIPLLWLGLEYFRSELYPLRFAWVTLGSACAQSGWSFLYAIVGGYGFGAVMIGLGEGIVMLRKPWQLWLAAVLAGIVSLGTYPFGSADREMASTDVGTARVRVGGVQLEFPDEFTLRQELDALLGEDPSLDLVVLSEYTLSTAPPGWLLDWCRDQQVYLVVGGKRMLEAGQYHNSVFVIDPAGQLVHEQAKAVPIQFFQDGLPATSQTLWESPWGRIGICICYDLSFTRVVDRLVDLGAEWVVVPTMDVVAWGEAEHELHGFIAPIRAAEYQVPIFRLASSGISQSVDASGRVRVAAPFPGQGEHLVDEVVLSGPGSLPWDRYLAYGGVGFAMVMLLEGIILRVRRRRATNDRATSER